MIARVITPFNRLFWAALVLPWTAISYLHALTDLRHARAHVERRGGDPQMKWDEKVVIHEIDEAIRQLQETLRLRPDHAQAHNNLGTAFYQQGRVGEAIQQFQEALKLRPDYVDARRNLEVVLATKASSSATPAATTNR